MEGTEVILILHTEYNGWSLTKFQFVAYEFSGIFGENNNPWTSVMFCVKFVIPCDDNEILLIFNIYL